MYIIIVHPRHSGTKPERSDRICGTDNMVKCPKCKKELDLKYKDSSFGKNSKKYERVIYVCSKDDIWVSVEIPEEIIKNDN